MCTEFLNAVFYMTLRGRLGYGILVSTGTLQNCTTWDTFPEFCPLTPQFHISVQFNYPTAVSYCKTDRQKSHKIRNARNTQFYSNITRC